MAPTTLEASPSLSTTAHFAELDAREAEVSRLGEAALANKGSGLTADDCTKDQKDDEEATADDPDGGDRVPKKRRSLERAFRRKAHGPRRLSCEMCFQRIC